MDKIDDINRNAAAAIADTLPVSRDRVSVLAAAAGDGRDGNDDEVNQHRTILYSEFWPALSRMPPLSHYPDRTKPFDPTRSEVYAYVLCECRQLLGFNPENPVCLDSLEDEDFRLLGRIHNTARERGVIRFDPDTKLWRGMAAPWERYRKPREIQAEKRQYRREARSRAAETYVCETCGQWFHGEAAFRAHVAEQRLIELGYWPETEDSFHA